MSINSITLRRVNKKFNEFGLERATLSEVITLLTGIFATDEVAGAEKLHQFEDLIKCATNIVDNKLRLQEEKLSGDLDEESLAMIRESEESLSHELFLFCETFNAICSSIGVVEYFSNNDASHLWKEITEFLHKEA